jgi:hypothetical protein
MSLFSRVLSAFVVFSCLVLSSALAQQGSSVPDSLNGSVTDASAALMSGGTTVTGSQGSLGRYGVDDVVPGFYHVSAEAPGFKKLESKSNEVVVKVSFIPAVSEKIADLAFSFRCSPPYCRLPSQRIEGGNHENTLA